MTDLAAELTVFYDASCPVCSLEIDHLAARDAKRACRLRLIDISAPHFDVAAHGFDAAALDAAMHVRHADGSVERGVPALRLVYEAAGLGRWVAPTGWRWLAPAFDLAYRAFARRRHAISGRLAPAIGWLRRHRAVSARAGEPGASS